VSVAAVPPGLVFASTSALPAATPRTPRPTRTVIRLTRSSELAGGILDYFLDYESLGLPWSRLEGLEHKCR